MAQILGFNFILNNCDELECNSLIPPLPKNFRLFNIYILDLNDISFGYQIIPANIKSPLTGLGESPQFVIGKKEEKM